MPVNISIARTTAMVVAMAKLHNFCLAANDISEETLPADALHLDLIGAIPLNVEEGTTVPASLLGGGAHFDDINRAARRLRAREYTQTLPRERLHGEIVTNGLTRPVPIRRRH
jgi:hypothetical protein